MYTVVTENINIITKPKDMNGANVIPVRTTSSCVNVIVNTITFTIELPYSLK